MPTDPTAVGAQLIRQGRPAEALARLQPALASDDARAWYTAAVAWSALGDVAQAEGALRRAVTRAPGWADAWCELGRTLAARGVRDEPERCWRRAVACAPTHVDARVRLAFALTGAGRLDEAGEHLAAALRVAPSHPGVVAAAIGLLERRGHPADAWALAARVPEADPQVAIAAASPGRATGHADAALRRVDRALREAADGYRALLLHARADLLDALDRPDEAFAAWTAANESRGLSFDPERHLAAIESLIHRTRPVRWAGDPGPEHDRPVLIVGPPRTGSTLLEQALSRHPQVGAAGELEALRDAAIGLARPGDPDWVAAVPHAADALAAARSRYLRAATAAAGPRDRVTDKMPNNLLHLGVFAALFPGARVIRMTRDPRDTAFSCYRQNFGPGLPWATSLPGIAAWLTGADRLLDHWEATLPLRFHSVAYESLVRDPHAVLAGVLAFLDLPFDPAVLAPEAATRAVATASALEVRQPVHQRSVGRASRYHAHLRPWFSGA